MTDNLTISGEALGNTGVSLDYQATMVPLGEPLDLANCQSSKVVSAANSFNMWAALTGVIAQDALQQSAQDITTIARTFGDWDAHTAHVNAGMI